MEQTTTHHGWKEIDDGYNGHKVIVHIVFDPDLDAYHYVHKNGSYVMPKVLVEFTHEERVILSSFR
jgi:hypothetical protein